MPKPIFSVQNNHSESCGTPMEINTSNPNLYTGYFMNSYGEQFLFVFDRIEKKGVLFGGDLDWSIPYPVLEGKPDGINLNLAEELWLKGCWLAAVESSR